MAIRVSRAAAATVKFSTPQEIVVSHTDDSIKLGDGTDLVTTTTVGSDVGLDVNVVGGSITIGGLTAPTITNLLMTSASTQYSHVIGVSSKKAKLKVRGNGKLQIAFVSGQTASNFITLYPGNSWEVDNLTLGSPLAVYFQSNKAGEILEVVEWS